MGSTERVKFLLPPVSADSNKFNYLLDTLYLYSYKSSNAVFFVVNLTDGLQVIDGLPPHGSAQPLTSYIPIEYMSCFEPNARNRFCFFLPMHGQNWNFSSRI